MMEDKNKNTSMNFMSLNPTGFNLLKADWFKDLVTTCDIHLTQIQEHFKTDKNTESFFKDKFIHYDSYVVPAYRSPDRDCGRA